MHEEHKKELVIFFFSLRNNLYLYHLTTYAYSRHVAVASLVDKFDDLIDKFLEIYFGKYGRIQEFSATHLPLNKLSDPEAFMELSEYSTFLTEKIPEMIDAKDTDLFNIRDEMVGILNNAKYLFELK